MSAASRAVFSAAFASVGCAAALAAASTPASSAGVETEAGNALHAAMVLPVSVQAQSREGAAPEGRFALDSGGKIVVGELAGGAGRVVPTAGVSNDAGSVGFSPDGAEFVFSRGGRIFVAGTDSGRPRLLSRSPVDAQTPHWTPDGLSFAYGYDGFAGLCDRRASAVPGIVFASRDGIRVREFDVGPARPTPTLARAFSLVGWRPDGSRLLYLETDLRQGDCEPEFSDSALRTSLLTVGRSGGRPALVDRAHSLSSPEWSADGTRVVYGRAEPREEDCAVWIVGAGGKSRRKLYEPKSPIGCRSDSDPWIAWAGPGSVYVAEADELVVVSIANGRRRVLMDDPKLGCSPNHNCVVTIEDVSPDGARVALSAEGGGGGYGTRRALIVLDRSGAELLRRRLPLDESLTVQLD